MKALIALALFGLLLTGCATSGRPISQDKVDQIQVGETTFDQMQEIFGPPVAQGYGSGGKLTATWFYVKTGAFIGIQQQKNLAVLFDEEKRVEEYTFSGTGG
ncbi:outer membrane protein assembly factor BamE domain-containing protein [Marinobacter sp. 1Y8]